MMVNRYRITASILSIILVLMLSWVSAAAATTSKSIPRAEYQIFTAAKQALEANHHDIGINLMRQYFQTHQRRHQFAYELYGHLLLLTNKPAMAIEVYQQGNAEYPEHLNLLQNLAVSLARDNQSYKAGQAYQQAYELGGENRSELAFSAAVMYERAANYQQSILLLKEILRTADDKPNWLLLLAQCYLQQNDNEDALEVLLHATQRFPFNVTVWRSLSLCYHRLGENEHAVASYQIANIVDEGTGLDSAQLGTKFLSLGAINMGGEWQNNEADGFQDLAINQFFLNGNLNEALKRAIVLQAQQPTALRKFTIGKLFQRLGQFEEAERIYGELVAQGGELQAKSLWALVLLYWGEAQWDEVSLRLQQLQSVDVARYQQSEKLRDIVEQILLVGR